MRHFLPRLKLVGRHYWHPFSDVSLGAPTPANRPNYTVAHHYQQLITKDPKRFKHASYYDAVHSSYRTRVRTNHVAPEAAIAFHVDALKLTTYLERKLTGIEVLESDQVDPQIADGEVSGLALDGGRIVRADLYVDCTGFNRAIHQRVAEADILPYEANVNRAVAAQVPYKDLVREPTPYTGAHAHEHGWTWSIPLKNRIGSGYVYNADFCSPDQAERNFRAYWGEERMRDVEVAHISFPSATLRNSWSGNVVAIGLSAGFVEPLEATGVNWMITSAGLLCRELSTHYYDADTAAKYNANILGYITDTAPTAKKPRHGRFMRCLGSTSSMATTSNISR